jgi:hypothetical protein
MPLTRSLKLLFSFIVIMLMQESCVKHEFPSYTCPDEPVSYTADIHAIVSTKCAISGCHNGDNGADKKWSDFSLFQAKAKTGEVKRRVVNRIMPPASSAAGPLTADEIAKIACWTDQGSPNN